jgi:aromatic-L-amino-acid/L-tryptophan decarboxylase
MPHSYDHQAELEQIRTYLATHASFETQSTLAEVKQCATDLLANWSEDLVLPEIERHTLEFFMRCMGMDASRSVAHLTDQPNDAHHSSVLVALAQCFPDFAEQGLTAMENPPRLYAAGAGIETYRQIARTVGLGSRAVRAVPVDAHGQMNVTSLRKAIIEDAREGFTPFFIAVDAGCNSTAAIDPIKKLVALGRVQGMWVHVNAAAATAALFGQPIPATLDGLGLADSVCLDAHRGLGVPLETAMFFCRHLRPVAKVDQALFDRRPVPAMQLFMHLGRLGRAGLARQFEGQMELAQKLRTHLTGLNWCILDSGLLPKICATPENRSEIGQVAQALTGLDTISVAVAKISGEQEVLQIEISDNLSQPVMAAELAEVVASAIANSIK